MTVLSLRRLGVTLAALLLPAGATLAATPGETHLKQYRNGIPGDKTVAAAAKLNIQVPVMCREWHLWWGAPYGSEPHMPRWQHWKGQSKFRQFDPATTIEQTIPGSSWRRWLNCTGYPLIGPYDSGQSDIIRWQLETARNAGIECLHIHLWPSLWDDGADQTPLPIFETILDTAAKMNYPVAVHDEIMFRRPPITKAQNLENCIRRTTNLLKRYGKHPGWYKIDGMPVIYFQNWSGWMKPDDLAVYLAKVEAATSTPVYWMVEQGGSDAVFKIPQIKAVLSHNNSWFLHVAPFGLPPHPWDKLQSAMQKSANLARKYGKKLGILVYTRFNDNNDRNQPGRGRIPAEDGMFFVESLRRGMALKPDFVVLTQWNDFEECAFIEPAWDYDGNNGDPYRYCRIVAATMNKKFTPAPLPERRQLDPYIRHKLYGDTQAGDMGPVAQQPRLADGKLTVTWTDGPKATEVRFLQRELAVWRPDMIEYRQQKLRLANWSALNGKGTIGGNGELRFYAPGLVDAAPRTVWLGLRVTCPKETSIELNYRSWLENYRFDSRWERRTAALNSGITSTLPDQSVCYWVPLYDAQLAGLEGDLLLKLKGKKQAVAVHEVILWTPDMKEQSVTPAAAMPLPAAIDAARPLVAVPYDAIGNPGTPLLLVPGAKQP